MDGPSEDLTAEAHPGRDHQAALRTAPRGPGHAGTHEEPAGGHHALPWGHRGSAHVDEAARYSLVVARTPAWTSRVSCYFRFTLCGCVHFCCQQAEGWSTPKVRRRSCMWTSGLTESPKSNTLKPKHRHASWRSLSETHTGKSQITH